MTGWARVLAAVGLLLTAGGVWTVADTLSRPPHVGLLGGNAPINAGATDRTDLTAHNSPTLVRNPTDPANLVVASRIDTPRFLCAVHVSSDGGVSWTAARIPVPEGAEQARCYAPDAAFGPDGTLHLSFVTLTGAGNTPDALWVTRSEDGGASLATPERVAGPLAFQVRLVTDPTDADRLWLTWVQADAVAIGAFPEPGQPVVAARSDDGGRTWQEPVQVSHVDRQRVVAPVPAVAGDGTLTVAYLDLGDDRLDYHGAHRGRGGPPYPGQWWLVVARSDDGRDFQEAVVDELVPTERFVVFLPPFPAIVAADGTVYVAFHDGRGGDPDVWLWRSDDGGRTWSVAVRVNDTPLGDGTTQRLPVLSVGDGGRLDTAYYDRRGNPQDVLTGVSFQTSVDGGRSFSPRVELADEQFDTRIGPGSERGMADLGSRIALTSTADRAMAVWTDTRGSTLAAGAQDLVRTVVEVTVPSPRLGSTGIGALRAAAGVLALAGVAVLGVRAGAKRP